MIRRFGWQIAAGLVAVVMSVLVYFLANTYVVDQVEKRVRDTMLECRAFHEYVQRNMHPAYFSLIKDGRLPEGFYAPELLSSSFIARTFQKYYNEERRKVGLSEVRYKMAANDPRNPVNQADAREKRLIAWFNEDKGRTHYHEIVREGGKKYFLYARPFLAIEQRCLKCHGAPEDAPAKLREIYHWSGGWNLDVGSIVAAEIIRSPLEGEYNAVMTMIGGFVLVLGLGLTLLGLNGRLRMLVAKRTQNLLESQQRLMQLNRLLAAIRNVNQLITQEKNRNRLLEKTCHLLVETRGFHSAYVVLIENGHPVMPFIHAGIGSRFEPMAEWLLSGNRPNCARGVIDTKDAKVLLDPAMVCGDCPLAPLFSDTMRFSTRLEHEGRVFGWLTVSVPREFPVDPEEQALFEEMANDISFALWTLDMDNQQRRTEAERERLLLAIEQAQEIVVITDASGTIQYVNPAFERITGFSGSEAIGENPRILKSGRHGRAFYKDLWDTILSGKPWSERLTNKRKNGTLYTCECSVSPVKDETGNVVNFVWISRDITNELELERKVSQARKMEAIGVLAGGIAHDFNNILYPIIGFSEMFMENLPTGSSDRENAEVIFKSALRAADLVKQILTFSRQAEHEKMPVRIQPILKEVLKLTRSTIPSSIEITNAIQTDCGMVLADPTKLHQIVMNLITNAYHAVEETDGSIFVQLKESVLAAEACAGTPLKPGRYAVMSVTDNGCGIDPANRGKIFEPFFTTKDPGKGTGLGLSVVYGIVKDFGGEVRVYSEPGNGTSFSVYLPIIDTDAKMASATGVA